MKSYTAHCNKSTSPIIFTATLNTHSNNPRGCPRCGIADCFLTETDGWDSYALTLNASRKLTILLLNKFDRSISAIKVPVKSRTHTSNSIPTNSKVPFESPKYRKDMPASVTNAELANLAIQSLPAELTHGTCMINASCNGCGSSFTFSVSNEPKTVKMPLTHCPYCATPSLIISPAVQASYAERSIEQWRHLADTYETTTPPIDESPESILVRIADIRAKYTYWETHVTQQYPTFSAFMADYTNIIANELLNPATPRYKASIKVHANTNSPSVISPTSHSSTAASKSLKEKPKHKKIRFVIRKPALTPGVAASNTATLPIPAHTYTPAAAPVDYVPEYSNCGICGCEQPRFVQHENGNKVPNMAAYCEPCTLFTSKERIGQISY